MGAISQMAEKCQKCPDRDKCSHKRMEACAYIDEPYVPRNIVVGIGNQPQLLCNSLFNAGDALDIKNVRRAFEKYANPINSRCKKDLRGC